MGQGTATNDLPYCSQWITTSKTLATNHTPTEGMNDWHKMSTATTQPGNSLRLAAFHKHTPPSFPHLPLLSQSPHSAHRHNRSLPAFGSLCSTQPLPTSKHSTMQARRPPTQTCMPGIQTVMPFSSFTGTGTGSTAPQTTHTQTDTHENTYTTGTTLDLASAALHTCVCVCTYVHVCDRIFGISSWSMQKVILRMKVDLHLALQSEPPTREAEYHQSEQSAG